MDSNTPQSLLPDERLVLDLDLRLLPVMVEAWDHDGWGAEFACLLRLAYGAGYTDALTEAVPAQLCREHRLRIPQRRSAD